MPEASLIRLPGRSPTAEPAEEPAGSGELA
jgi:hypothetical protein